MFLIKKLLTPFLLPPGVFSALAFFLAAVRFKKDRKQAQPFWPRRSGSGFMSALRYVRDAAKRGGQAPAWASFALLIWAVSINPVGDAALGRLEYAYLPPAELKADALVLLSGGIKEGAPGLFGVPELTGDSLERATSVVRIYRRYKLPVIVTGGTVLSTGSEAGAIKKYLVNLGVPQEKIFVEENARDTWENAVFSKKICDGKGYKKAAIITSAYHMRRAVWSFKKAGFRDPVPYPTAYKTSKAGKYYYADFLPGSCENLRKALHEYLGLIFYAIYGGVRS